MELHSLPSSLYFQSKRLPIFCIAQIPPNFSNSYVVLFSKTIHSFSFCMSDTENTCRALLWGSSIVETKQETTPFLQIFWDLAEVDIKKREIATRDLLSYLREHQDSAEQEQFPGCSRDMIYTIKRLCNGICSRNDGARQGFSLALTYPLEMILYMRP